RGHHHGKDQKNQNQKPILQTFLTPAVSTKVDTYQQPREPVGGGAVWACRTVGAMDGFTACPAGPHRPAQPAEIQHRFCR
ncbi:TPA: hypothetical protein ACKPYB_003806, partial [Stenotrophomonas maltophilia]